MGSKRVRDRRVAPTEVAYDQHDVAAIFGVSHRTVEGWRIRGGGPPYFMAGGLVRYWPSRVHQWLVEREKHSTSAISAH